MTNEISQQRSAKTSALPFEFTAALPLETALSQLKKMTIPESPTNIAFFRIDADNQRFYLTSRAFRSHLIEAKGLLKRVDDSHTQVSGDVFGKVRSTLLTALLAGFALVLLIALMINLWYLVAALVLGIAAVAYWLLLAEQVEADKAELIRLFDAALASAA